MQTCYAKWLSIFSGYCEFNATCAEWKCHNFFSFSFVVFSLVPFLFACDIILW